MNVAQNAYKDGSFLSSMLVGGLVFRIGITILIDEEFASIADYPAALIFLYTLPCLRYMNQGQMIRNAFANGISDGLFPGLVTGVTSTICLFGIHRFYKSSESMENKNLTDEPSPQNNAIFN